MAHGYFVRPTVLAGLPRDHQLMREELFVPIVAVETVDSLDEALARANDTHFGLTAGLFSREQAEIDAFLDRIEAGVVYVNRAAGATTGAWPGVQPFGGWKGSGSTGKNIGGPLHPALLPARAEPDGVRMTAPAKASRRALEALAAQPISIVTEPPGPRAREMIARALPHLSPSLIHCYPLMVKRASGCMVEDVDGNVYLDAEAGVATASTGHCHPAGGRRRSPRRPRCSSTSAAPTSTTRATARSARRLGALAAAHRPEQPTTGRRSSPTRAPKRSRRRSSWRATTPGGRG